MSIESMKEEINEIRKKAAEDGRFTLFDSADAIATFRKAEANKENFAFFLDVYKAWDLLSNLPVEVGQMIEKEMRNPDTIIGVHRAKMDDERLKDVMENGLYNYGHINAVGGSIVTKMPSPELTLTPLDGFTGYLNLFTSYKNNNLMLLFKLPRDVVDNELTIRAGADPEKIYDLSERNPKLKPELIMGVIKKNQDALDEFYTREEYLYSNKDKKR